MAYTFKLSRRLAVAHLPARNTVPASTDTGTEKPFAHVGPKAFRLSTESHSPPTRHTLTLARRLAVSGTLAGIALALACSATNAPNEGIARLVVQPQQAALQPGQQQKFTAYGQTLAGDLAAVDVTWHATGGQVSSDGMFRADTTPGAYMVMATANGAQALADTSFVQVDQLQLDSLVITPQNPTVRMGSSLDLTATGYTSAGDTTTVAVTWTSSDGTITSNGKAKGHYKPTGPGNHQVGATGGGRTDTTTVTVTPDSVATVSIAPSNVALYVGSTKQLTATLKDSAGATMTGVAVAWSSSNAAVATVDTTGLVTARGAGTATIGATSEGISSTAAITASTVPVASVGIAPATVSVLVGQTAQLTAVVRDSAGNTLSGRAVTWASNNTGVATVSNTGLVTAVAAGAATIMATSEGKSGAASVTASVVPVASVTITPSSAALLVGQTTQLAATTKDSAGNTLTGRVVTWTSSNAGAAAVSSTGLVTAASAGSATITATSEGRSSTASVTVSVVPVASVTVTPSSAALLVGQTSQLTATPKDSAGNALSGRSITWSSSNAGVATVSGTGQVTAVAAGSATITATSQGKSGSATITVSLVPVASVSVTPSSDTLQVSQTVQLTATPRDSTGKALTGRAVAWTSSNAAVATVNGTGLVTAIAAGSATVTATSEGRSGTAQASVTAPTANPAAVTDLAAAAATDSSVTLTFTEVTDGTGHAANYDVRYAVSPLSWGSAASVTRGTCATPLTGTTIGGKRTCTVLGLASSTTYQFQLIAYRGTLNVDAVFGPLSNLVTRSTTGSTITPPPPGDSEPVDPGSGYLFADNFNRYPSVIAMLSPGNCPAGTDGYGVPNAYATYGNHTRPNAGGAGTCTAPGNYSLVAGRNGGNAVSNHFISDPNLTQLQESQGTSAVWTANWGSGGTTDNFSYASGRTIVFQVWFKGTGPGVYYGKWFTMWYNGGTNPSGRIEMGIWYTHRNPSWSVNANGVNDRLAAQPVGPYPEVMTDNQWHRMTIAYKPNSSGYGQNPSSRDGLFRAWIDGTKIIDLSASAIGVTPPGGAWPWCTGNGDNMSDVGAGLDWLPAGDSHQIAYIRFPDYVNGASNQFDLAFDDLKVWTTP